MRIKGAKTLYGNRSFRQRVSSPTYEVDSPTSNFSSPTPLNYRTQGHFCPYTHFNYSSFFYPLRSQKTAKYVYPKLLKTPYNLFLVLSSTRHTTYSSFFHHCRAKRKSILDIGPRSDWHISVGKLTFDVGVPTSHVGELVVTCQLFIQSTLPAIHRLSFT